MTRRAAAGGFVRGWERAAAALAKNHRRKPGREVAGAFAEAVEEALLDHVEATVARLGIKDANRRFALVATGGTARREPCRHSDLDLCLVFRAEPAERDVELVRELYYPLIDAKIPLGRTERTLRDLEQLLHSDLHTATSFLGARLLHGSKGIFAEVERLARETARGRHREWLLKALLDETARRRQREETPYVIEPHLKDSRGTLRDLHTIHWAAEHLAPAGAAEDPFTPGELDALGAAHDFLLEVRNELHLMEGREQDQLTVEHQIVAAPRLGFEAREQALPEEALMRRYYRHAREVDHAMERVLEWLRAELEPPARGAAPAPRWIHGIQFEERGGVLSPTAETRARVESDPGLLIEYAHRAASAKARVDAPWLRGLRPRVDALMAPARESPANRERFLAVLRDETSADRALALMHRWGVLGAYLPEFKLVELLPRIDQYHRYTVDEHLLRAVRSSREARLGQGVFAQGPVAEEARSVLRWDLLNLALLLHDVAKGLGKGHVVRGAQLAQQVGERIGLNKREQMVVRTLVGTHQLLTHLVTRRDPEDPGSALEAAGQVNDPEVLRMLFVHTACDLSAVSSSGWNEWRAAQLHALYVATRKALSGMHPSPEPLPPGELVEKVLSHFGEGAPDRTRREVAQFLEDMPSRYRSTTPPEAMARHAALAAELHASSKKALLRLSPLGTGGAFELLCVADDVPGLFVNLCGAIAGLRANIHAAQVYTGNAGICIDVFQLHAPKRASLDADVVERLEAKLNAVIEANAEEDWGALRRGGPVREPLRDIQPEIKIDNEVSPQYTVVEVFAADRPRLLYSLACALNDCGLSVELALISTESYRVADVFYVTGWDSNKLTDPVLQERLRRRLLQALGAEPDPAKDKPKRRSDHA
ncbi:MAG: DUF294 nucleotidyltransferase-like domain-containing protein [Candidatus Sumerlaeia bacterium]|nr:DUF294 nucleotidyltransferase-like domain-containing protein [Candidatus Sumerlaeia bacterium]